VICYDRTAFYTAGTGPLIPVGCYTINVGGTVTKVTSPATRGDIFYDITTSGDSNSVYLAEVTTSVSNIVFYTRNAGDTLTLGGVYTLPGTFVSS